MQDLIIYIVLVLLCVVIYLLINQKKSKSDEKNNEELTRLKESLTNSISTMSTSFNKRRHPRHDSSTY
jgi:cbb3-type cytochrome oxidase subunit 3